VAGRKKKLPWNHDLKIPGFGDEPPSPPPKPSPGNVTVGHSTGAHAEERWECLRCVQLADGTVPSVLEHSLRCPKRDPAVKS
jgi:hypothetical protein